MHAQARAHAHQRIYTECMDPQQRRREKNLEKSSSKIIRHARTPCIYQGKQSIHTYPRVQHPWLNFLGYTVATVKRRGKKREICWRTYCGRQGPPDWVPLPHTCLTSVTSEPWKGPSTQSYGTGWNLSSRVAVRLGCRRQLARVLFPEKQRHMQALLLKFKTWIWHLHLVLLTCISCPDTIWNL